MDIATIALLVSALALVAVLAVLFTPGRNAVLGAWSLASWTGKRRRPRDGAGEPPSRRS